MRNLWWICWYLWEGLPTLFAFPVNSTEPLGTGESWSTYLEHRWPRYAIGILGFVSLALTLAGCLCCRRQRRPKGFQEFKDGSTSATETTHERVAISSLELEVARIASSQSASSNKVQFEALPIDRLVSEAARITVKPKPPSPSLFAEEQRETERSNFLREQPCREWFDASNCHVPRERLKYLREIGRGWFGKVVEGTAEIPNSGGKKNRGVVVRILTEEATTREKAWFLGEATPYLKLEHQNVLTLLGTCLEADPYLLLFESCPAGDLKGFLRGNRDKGTYEALYKENVPTRMALDIANALEHMHESGFAHTDLSARNCLVATDLSAKLGDYGTGVEKYPGDYYIVGDRALPIRWSAPESLECTETTIETRAITPRANLWSYAILLWEMSTWGERPYDDLGDEQVIEMIFSLKSGLFLRETSDALLKRLREESAVPRNFREAVEAAWKFLPEERASLKEIKEILCGKRIEDFEKRWENLRPNGVNATKDRDNRSASLQDLRGSVDSGLWQSSSNDAKNPPLALFRLGPEEPVKNLPNATNTCLQESGSETEEESWRGRVERGAYTEKVKQKSKSVADLMVLVHIDSDSDAEISLGPQITEKVQKKRLPASGSDGDLRSHVLADEFDEAIRKLREPSVCNGTNPRVTRNHCESSQIVESIENPKLLTLTHQGQTPILRLCLETPEKVENSLGDVKNLDPRENTIFATSVDEKATKSINTGELPYVESEEINNSAFESKISLEKARVEGPVLRLVSKGDPDLPLLRYVHEANFTPDEIEKSEEIKRFDSFLVFEGADSDVACFSNNFAIPPSGAESRDVAVDAVNVELWNNALAHELEKKNPGFEISATIFDESLDFTRENAKESTKRLSSPPNTSKTVIFTGETCADVDFASSAPETPRNKDFARPIVINSCANVDCYENLSVGTLTAPESPEKNYFDTKNAKKSTNDIDYYQDSAVGSSSAPETPRKHFFESDLEDKSPKRANYYRDSVGSASAPETPQFRGNYATPQLDEDSSVCEDLEASERMLRGSAPDTPQSRGNYSVGNGDEDSSTGEELDAAERIIKRSSHEADDEERKHLSTPDDERSSDSGFRDKESCEEEESPVPCPQASGVVITGAISSSALLADSSPLSASAEEEQMRILFELDTILDAEYYGSFRDADRHEESEITSPSSSLQARNFEGDLVTGKNRSISESLGSTESTDVVETVRANSCEPDFLDTRNSRDIAALMSPEEACKLENVETKKLGDFLRIEGETEKNFVIDTSDDTEADFLPDSASESMKTDKNLAEFSLSSSGVIRDTRKDSSDLSMKNESRSDDSYAERCRLKADSSGSGKFDGSNDPSIEIPNSDVLVISRSKTMDNSDDSPVKSEWLAGLDVSMDLRTNSSEISREISNSINRSSLKYEEKNENLETREISMEFDNSTNNSSSKSDKHIDTSDIFDVSMQHENSNSSSLPKSEKPHKSSETCEASIEFDNSASDSPVKSEKHHKSSETCEISTEFDNSNSSSLPKSEKPLKSSEKCEILTEFDNSTSSSLPKSEKLHKSSETCEISISLENSASNSPLKSEKLPKTSETFEILMSLENSASNSPLKSEKFHKSSETYETSISLENSASNSPLKSEKLPKTSETYETSISLENSVSNSPLKSEKLPDTLETYEASISLENSASNSPLKSEKPPKTESCEPSTDLENSPSNSPTKSSHQPRETSETREASETDLENSCSDSPLKTDRNNTSEVSMETRGAESAHSDVDQWSSRENINENENDDEDSSTMSLRSDNSYVSFGLDEEFVAAIRNELREKLPRAQMPVVEALDPRDEKEPSINNDTEAKRWEDEEETEESGERGSGGVDISIRYNIYGTPLSPILEERESAGTSESLVSKEDSRDDASIASRVSALSEDVLVVDTRTNVATILDGSATGNGEPSNSQQDEDRDTSHGDFSDEENLEYPQNNLNRGMENKRICMGSGGAPLPSPEEETKWQQQFPLPLQMQDDLMSTSFGTDRDWDSQDDEEGEDEAEEGEEDEEENSSSSGEFVWKRYDESHGDLENVATRSPPNKPKSHEPEADLEEEDEGGEEEDDDEEEEEFTPSAWDATLAPHRSALRSPEKTLKSGDQKKSVWFKKQRYHCVYEYPKETPVAEGQGQAGTTWEPTSYADWEEMMDEPRLDVYPMEYDETNRAGDEEFYVSSSNRPFQFQTGEGKYVSQFFPGASSTLLQPQQQQQQQQPVASSEDSQESQDEVDRCEAPASPHLSQSNGNVRIPDFLENQQQQQQQQTQLGELRHTRDRLKLNLQLSSGSSRADEDAVENCIADIETTENLHNKTPKTLDTTDETSKTVKYEFTSEKSLVPVAGTKNSETPRSEVKATLETRKSTEKNASQRAESEKSSNLENLAVNETPEGKIRTERVKEETKLTESIVATINEVRAANTPLSGDLAVIQSRDEVLSSREDSRAFGDEKVAPETRQHFAVEQIVDIPKLETEESPASAPESGEPNNSRAHVQASTRNVSANVAKNSASGAVKSDEKSSNIVQTLES